MRAETCVDVHVNLPSLMLTFNQTLSVQTDFSKFPTSNVGKEISSVQNFIFFDHRLKDGYRNYNRPSSRLRKRL